MAKTITQSPILNTDVESTAPDKNKKTVINKSRRRTSLNEFCIVNNIRPEVRAGFKVWLKGELFHFDDEWLELYNNYTNRKL